MAHRISNFRGEVERRKEFREGIKHEKSEKWDQEQPQMSSDGFKVSWVWI